MATQFHIGLEGFTNKLVFNGAIDGEPTISGTGEGTMTADPSEVIPTPTTEHPDAVETHVRLHWRNPTGGLPGMAGVAGFAMADDPNTEPEQEKILINFPEVGQWIAPAQPKANAVSLGNSEAEAL